MGKDARARQWSKTVRGFGENAASVDVGATAERGGLRVRTVRRRVLHALTGTMSVVTLMRAFVDAHEDVQEVNAAQCIQWARTLPPERRPWASTFRPAVIDSSYEQA
jgi:hypothetical protein